MAQRAYTITRPRIVTVVIVAVAGVVGALLPYLTVTYLDFTSQQVRPTHALFPTTKMLSTMDIGYFPSSGRANADTIGHGIALLQLGSTMQEIGTVVAVITVFGIFMNEINKFIWWPLLVSGFLLVLGPVFVFLGAHAMTSANVALSVRFGWILLVLTGAFVIVTALRNRSRLDSYRGV